MSVSEIEVVAAEETALGMICLRRRGVPSEPDTVVTEITLDHQFLMSSENTASERALAARALALHPGSGLRVLVGGLGLGYTAHTALASERVASVDVVELLPPVIEWLARGLVPLADALRADARLAVRHGDVYAELARPPRQPCDLILIDVDHSPDERLGPSSEAFYGSDGLARAKRHLAPGGVLAVWSCTESSPFADALHAVFEEVHVEPLSFHNRVVGAAETNCLFLARG